ncbi:MAG: VWA domain-containing protein [Thermoproteales archaeon]|nr:VWA domain-containing protein [Thermoproteales archaeon]
MRLPRKIERILRRIRTQMRPTPHNVVIDERAETSYSDIENRVIGLSKNQLDELDWIYRHEIMHLDKYPRTISNEIIWQVKIANMLSDEDRSLFRKLRHLVINMAEDSVIDYYIGLRYKSARKYIKKYVENLPKEIKSDPPCHEGARMIVAGVADYPILENWLKDKNIIMIGLDAFYWLKKHQEGEYKSDTRGKPSREDYEKAAGQLITEGENIIPLYEFSVDDNVEFDLEKASLIALTKRYEWYISAIMEKERTKGYMSRQGVWIPGDEPSKLNVYASLLQYNKIIPGLTAIKRDTSRIIGWTEPSGYRDVAILVDESGSMRDKEKATRMVGISLLAWFNRWRIQYQIIGFGSSPFLRAALGFDYTGGVRYFSMYYRAWGNDTRLAPALNMLKGRNMLLYVISDAKIYDLNKVAEYKSRIKEVVLVLINKDKKYREFTKAFKGVTVRGYWLNPEEIDKFIIQELEKLH